MLAEVARNRVVEKTRHLVPAGGGLTWEIDVFAGPNQGLVVAEIELPDEDAGFTRPAWLGEEVTGDGRYLNNALSERPWSTWGQSQG